MKKNGAAEFLLQNIDTFLHHANAHLGAGVEESVINELTNASNSNVKVSIEIGKKPNGISYEYYDDLSGEIDQDKTLNYAYKKYLELQNKIIRITHELMTLKSVDIESLSDRDRMMHLKGIEHCAKMLKNYQFTLSKMAERISYKQELEAIEQLREND
ncbi:hypothetical protein SS11_02600 [Klebsiella aerogenes]|nr:hypothetical protein SS11_02600 [Klebsiella aerogenes]